MDEKLEIRWSFVAVFTKLIEALQSTSKSKRALESKRLATEEFLSIAEQLDELKQSGRISQ